MRRFDDIDYRRRPTSYEPADGADELLCGLLSADLGRPWPTPEGSTDGGSPRFFPGEVEIARLEALRPIREMVSIRARPAASGGFAYRALNNAGRHYAPDPTLSDEPLSLGELVTLMETLRPGGLVERLLNHAFGAGLPESEVARAIRVESRYYPELGRHYRKVAKRVMEEYKR